VLSRRKDELQTMTNSPRSAIELKLTIELGLAIAFAAAWLAARQTARIVKLKRLQW
jgi:hypothetical protein